jgi:hypothetical protein
MAGTTRTSHPTADQHSRDLEDTINGLVTLVDALLAKMDADFADVTNASVDYSDLDVGDHFKINP